MSEGLRDSVRIAPLRKTADEWALVLASQGLHPVISRTRDGFALDVPDAERERADAALAAYERENPATPPDAEEPPPANFAAGLVISTLLLAFYAVTGPRDFAVNWFERGSADAERILHGEAWRTATALTLHADLGHVVGNAIAGTIFISAVCGSLGVGFGGALVLASGAAGNFANAVFHGAQHTSVGASTAIFGAVGILGSLGVAHHRRRGVRGRRALAPIAAGLGLLAMLGTSPRADLWAHFFGLVAGALLGLACCRTVARPPGPVVQWLLGGAAAAALVGCWFAALG
jgi:membrane associated rhomboid family serine protease